MTVERRPPVGGVLASLALCMLLPSLGTSIANVALPTLVEAFAASFRQVQWVVLAYLLAATTSIVSVGWLGDLAGRRRLLVAGIFLFTVASALCGVAPGLWQLIAARAAQGLGAAVMMALTMAFVGEAVPRPRTGSAMGLLGTVSAAGTALGPSLGGILIGSFGWRTIFFVNVPLGVVALVLAQRYLPADRAARRASKTDQTGCDGVGTLVLRDSALRARLAMSALVSTVVMATLVVGPFYLARALGLGTAHVGIVMSVGPVIAALAGVPAGLLVDRFGAPLMGAGGLAGMAAGCSALALAPAATGIAGYVIPIVALTAGYGLFLAANNTAVMADAAAGRRGVVSGLLSLSRNLGLIAGTSVMGAVFTLASRANDFATARPEAVAAGMRVTFAVAAGLVGVALAVALRQGLERDGRRHPLPSMSRTTGS